MAKTTAFWVTASAAAAVAAVFATSSVGPPSDQTRPARSMLLGIAGAQMQLDSYIGSKELVFCPSELPTEMMRWPTTCESTVWRELGVPRPSQTRFQYAIVAGGADEPCLYGEHLCASIVAGEAWWVAVARTSLPIPQRTLIVSSTSAGLIDAHPDTLDFPGPVWRTDVPMSAERAGVR